MSAQKTPKCANPYSCLAFFTISALFFPCSLRRYADAPPSLSSFSAIYAHKRTVQAQIRVAAGPPYRPLIYRLSPHLFRSTSSRSKPWGSSAPLSALCGAVPSFSFKYEPRYTLAAPFFIFMPLSRQFLHQIGRELRKLLCQEAQTNLTLAFVAKAFPTSARLCAELFVINTGNRSIWMGLLR